MSSNFYSRIKSESSESKEKFLIYCVFSEVISVLKVCDYDCYRGNFFTDIFRSIDLNFNLTVTEEEELNTIIEETGTAAIVELPNEYIKSNYTYDYSTNKTIPPQHYPSWIRVGGLWMSPVDYPNDGNEYTWDEAAYQADNTTGWVLVTPSDE